MRDYAAIVEAARAHYENLKTDIENSKDRIEHIRLTTLANEAHHLLTDLLAFQVGLVYSHTNVVNGPTPEPLDLPEFKSPYTPPAPLRLE
jgi:hypothetical protein